MLRRAFNEARSRLAFARDPVAYHRAGGVEIGSGVEIIGGSIHTFGSEPYLIRVGDDVTISEDVRFITHDGGLRCVRDRHPGAFRYGRIDVGDRVFIGAGAMILLGVSIGERAVVGARAVVTSDVEPGMVVGGVPARPIKPIDAYAEQHRQEWIDTRGLSFEQKRELLLRHLPPDARI